MFTVTIQTYGKPLKEFITDLNRFATVELRGKAFDLMNEIHKFMLDCITNSIKRDPSTGNLIRNITCKFEGVGGQFMWSFWIGDISLLDQNAPYWYWQNYGKARSGRTIPPANRGYFPGSNPPMQGEGGERWTHTLSGRVSAGDYFINPQKAISPMNYIERSANELEIRLNKILDGFKKL